MHEVVPKTQSRPAPIELAQALATLRANRSMLESMGVVHAGVFGSVARGEAGKESDLDIVVELDDSKVRTIYDFAGVWRALTDAFGDPLTWSNATRWTSG